MAWLNHRFKEAKHTSINPNPKPPTPVSNKLLNTEKFPSQCIRINSNAAITQGRSTIDIVARNHFGEVQKIMAVHFQYDIPEVAEAYRVLQALKLAIEGKWTKVCCISNAWNVIEKINHPNSQTTH